MFALEAPKKRKKGKRKGKINEKTCRDIFSVEKSLTGHLYACHMLML